MTTPGWQTNLGVLAFDYVNWRGEAHYYVVDFTAGPKPGFGIHDGKRVVSGELITRDGSERLDMLTRRRTFVVDDMRNVERVGDAA